MLIFSVAVDKKESPYHTVKPGDPRLGQSTQRYSIPRGPWEKRLGQTRRKIHSVFGHKDFGVLL